MMTFDVRAIIAWGLSAMLVGLLVRNPLVVLELLLIVGCVRATCVEPDRLRGIGWMIRIAPVLLAIGVLFNLLTVRSGDRVFLTIPNTWPLIGGPLTFNALAYGLVSAFGLFTLLLTGTTVAALMRWIDLTRVMPQRFAGIAVSGSVAWVYLPELTRSFADIRDSLILRGIPPRGPRTLVPLIVPLLGQGLERAMTTAEVLETRGFGGVRPEPGGSRRVLADIAITGGLVLLLVSGYLLVSGAKPAGFALAIAGCVMLTAGIVRRPTAANQHRRTRYREHRWQWRDTLITVSALAVVGVFLWRWTRDSLVLGFNPYPVLAWPPVDLVMMTALPLLLMPAVLVALRGVDAR